MSIKYRKHQFWLKAAIAMTGRPDLFENHNIPRTTANYWIKQQITTDDPVIAALTDAINSTKSKFDETARDLNEKTALLDLLKQIFITFKFSLRWKHIDTPEVKFRILDAMERAMTSAPRESCLGTIELSLSRYKRWRRERRGCGLTELKTCPKGKGNQLTYNEVQAMRNLVTSKEFAHFPIRSLQYFAKRKKILFCSYSTWRKYIDQYGWLRPRKKPRKKLKRIGIRAKGPNEIWHLDVSHFILPDQTKCFIQVIVDNYSRYIIAWQVLESYDGSKTADLLHAAIKQTIQPTSTQLQLIVDGGGENQSHEVKKLETKGYFKKKLLNLKFLFQTRLLKPSLDLLNTTICFIKK